MANRLDLSFYARDARLVAPELLGKVLVRQEPTYTLRARIVETEAYLGAQDEASHAHNGLTLRNATMFGSAGHLYVYFTYGRHFCANVVTGNDSVAQAVLLRAAEPLEGISIMEQNRTLADKTNLCNGPAKLAQAFGLRGTDNGRSLISSRLWFEDDGFYPQIATSGRVGISRAVDAPWRYYAAENKNVSKPNKSRYNSGHGRST